MIITGELKTTTRVLGSAPAKTYLKVFQDYVEGRSDEHLLTYAQGRAKKNESIESVLETILSVFNRDEKGNIIIGSWMFEKMIEVTARTYFNSKKDKTHPARDGMKAGKTFMVGPGFVNFYNGKLVAKNDGVFTCAVCAPDGKGGSRNFFKAYEYVEPGYTMKVSADFDDTLLSRDNIKLLLSKCGRIGIGAYRQRFGKFKWLNLKCDGKDFSLEEKSGKRKNDIIYYF